MAIIPATESGNTDQTLTVPLTAPGSTDWYTIEQGTEKTMVELVPGAGGTAKVQLTIDADDAKAGNVDGVDWDAGEVSVRTQLVLNGGGFIRMVVSAGTEAKMIIKGIQS